MSHFSMDSLETRKMFAVTATFARATLSVMGDNLDNTITVSRDAAGKLLVNGGAVAIRGGTPTVANTSLISVFGLGGNDTLTLNEANGALPKANLFGGLGNDVLTGGSGNDMLFGQAGNDTALGKGGFDFLFGGSDSDILTGGDANDQVFGESGNDRMIWNPGDDTDLNEGGSGTDTVEVNGGGGDEQFTATANGTRVRFDRLNPAPFSIDMGTSEKLVLNANGGSDSFSATGNLAALIQLTVDGGSGNDSLLGSNGVDLLLGGDGNDFIDGQQGNDVAFMGAGDDVFQWDPGDGSDVIEGQDGFDSMLFNGSNGAELVEASASGSRTRFTRNLGNIVMDLNDVEGITYNALGGADITNVNDLNGTGLVELNVNHGATGDSQADTVVVNGTNGDDVMLAAGDAAETNVLGLAAQVNIFSSEPIDTIAFNALAGDDVIEASETSVRTVQNGGEGNDVLIGGSNNDTLIGGAGDDVLIGGAGTDVLDGGEGDDVEIQ